MALSSEPWRLDGLKIVAALAPAAPCWLWDRVAETPPDIANSIALEGLQAIAPATADEAIFAEAARAIGTAESLAATVVDRTASVHLLRAQPGYDVSHSEPRWPDRIFVSVPERRDRVGALRLAESVIHEAMHLHLTVLETQCALVAGVTGQLMSPWRRAPRPCGGVLHGLFVFTCLQAFFRACREVAGSAASAHVGQRLEEIGAEIWDVDVTALAAGLTHDGKQFLRALLDANVEV